MFYIDHYCEDGRIAVADSDDGAIDLITKKELQDYINQGIQILTWQDAKGFVTARMNHNCNYYLWRKLNRNCSEDELMEYFQKYSNYTVVHNTQQFVVDYNARCRIFKYSEVSNYFIVVLFLKGGFPLIMRINDEYECIAQVIQTPCIFKSYPSCSGFLTNSQELSATEVADLYKERWQIELFFKRIKQNLVIKTFVGTTENAVMTQI